VAVVVTGTGVCISAWVRRVTTAVVLNCIACAVFWIGVPLLAVLLSADSRAGPSALFKLTYYAHPFAQIGVVTSEASGRRIPPLDGMDFRWVNDSLNVGATGLLVFVMMLINVGIGFFLCCVGADAIRGRPWESTGAAVEGESPPDQ
jgi:hypothetical protein